MGCNESAAPFGPEQQPRIQVAPLVLYQPAQWGNQQPDGGPAVCQAFPALRLSTPERYTVASLWHSWHEHTEASLEAGYTFFLKFERIWCPEVSTTIYSLYYSNTHTARQRNASVYISVQHSNIFKVHCAMAALFLFITLLYFCSFLLLLWVQKGIKALTPTPQYSYSVVCCCSTPVCFVFFCPCRYSNPDGQSGLPASRHWELSVPQSAGDKSVGRDLQHLHQRCLCSTGPLCRVSTQC